MVHTTLLLQARHLTFSHGDQPLIEDLSFELPPGLTLLSGGESRGKTTVLRLMAGQLKPQGGQLHRHAASLCFPQMADPALNDIVAAEWLAAQRAHLPAWDASAVAPLVQGFGLDEHLHKPLYMLSTGSRRKVGLVAALAGGAALTLLDMPCAALDVASCRFMAQQLARFEHDPSRACVVADYAWPTAFAALRCARVIDLGD